MHKFWVKNPCLEEFPDDHPRWCFGGGGSQGTTSTTTVQKSEPWSEQKDYLKYGFQKAQEEFDSGRPEYYPGQTYVGASDPTAAALMGSANRALQGSDIQNAGRDQYMNTVSGQFLNSNPYLRGAQEAAMRPVLENFEERVMPGVRGAFSAAGRYGSPAMAQEVERAAEATVDRLSDISTNMAYQNYRDERGVMDRAVMNAPAYAQTDYQDFDRLAQVGATQEEYQRTALQADIDRHNFEEQKEAAKLAQYMNLVQGNYGGTSTTTRQTPYYQQPAWMQGLGLGMQGAGAIGSVATKVICNEAHRQGLLPDDIHAADELYGALAHKTDPYLISGYHAWAYLVVRVMRRHRWFAVCTSAIARPVARELAYRVGVGRGSIVGKVLLATFSPICRLIGWLKEKRHEPVRTAE